MSAATAERVLRSQRTRHPRSLSTTRAGTLLKSHIPIRTFQEWHETQPGFLEGDLVAHCGLQAEGGYLYTLTLTDIATGWTECLPLLYCSRETVLAAFQRARTLFPFPILGIDTDNGGEFLNEELVAYCAQEQVAFTRGDRTRKEINVLSSRKMARLCAKWSARIAWLGNMPIGNSPNCIERCVCTSIVFSPR
jgi:hypothetical protein